MKKQLIFIFIFTFLVYFLTGEGHPTPYNYFTRLADAFLHKRIYLLKNPPWLNELVPVNEKYYVVYPPMPAILALPFVAFFGANFSQTLLSVLIGSLNSVLVFLILKTLGVGEGARFWLTALFAFGTIHWYLTSVGSAWYLGHIAAMFFLLSAINQTLGKKQAFLIGAFLGAAYWSRLPAILSFPFFLGPVKKNIKDISKFLLGVLIFVFLSFFYNLIRFGHPLEFGYRLIPGVLNEPWFPRGIFHLSYIGQNLKVLFLKLPVFEKKWPFVKPSWGGMAIWLTTPAFIYALKAPLKEKLVCSSWLALLLVAVPSLVHGSWGFAQFGYRFAMDFTPFLLILTAKGVGKKLKWHHKLLVILSVLVNLWGVVWINKFDWVGW